MRNLVSSLIILLVLQLTVFGEEVRTWTSKKGDKIEARYVRMFAGGKVVLKTTDGRELNIPVSGLCDKDQEYLASLVPPKLKIDVDVDVDDNVESSSDWYVRKSEVAKAKVIIKKTNMEPCSQTLKVYIYVFAQQERGDDFWVIGFDEKSLSFADGGKEVKYQTMCEETQYTSAEYQDAQGFRYDGYLVVVEDAAGAVVSMESNRKMFEKSWKKIKGSGQGHEFDKDFDRKSKKRKSSY